MEEQRGKEDKEMGTEISSISALFRADSTGSVVNAGNDSKVQNDFSSFLNLNNYKQNNTYQIQNDTAAQKTDLENTADATEYDKYQYQKSNVVKEAEERSYSTEELDHVNEKLNEFSETVKSVLKEELTVTEEQITNAMAVLQINFADLMDPQNLAALVTELTGCEDPMQLLMTESFQNVLTGVEEVTEQLLSELEMTKEQFTAICDEMQNTGVPTEEVFVQDLEETIVQTLEETVQTAEVELEDTRTADSVKTAEVVGTAKTADEVPAVDVNEPQDEAADDAGNGLKAVDDASQKQTEEENLPENASKDETDSSTDLFEKTKSASQTKTESHGIVFEQNTQTVNNNTTVNVQQVQAYVDVNNIMEQISEYTRVLVSEDATSLEMQLNPENLGKIYIHVSEKAGAITAQITATNESVKEALQAQIADLKENLNQQGIKVDAVEVTIESHEFEQNLEQNARREQEKAEQNEQKRSAGGRRNINLNDLDSLSGVMSEEESLVARMMQDNGNQMDVTA